MVTTRSGKEIGDIIKDIITSKQKSSKKKIIQLYYRYYVKSSPQVREVCAQTFIDFCEIWPLMLR